MNLEFSLRKFSRAGVLIAIALAVAIAAGCETTRKPDKIVLVPVDSFAKQWSLPLALNKRHDEISALYLRENLLIAYSKRNLMTVINADAGTPIFAQEVHPGQLPNRAPVLVKDWIAVPATSSIEIYTKDGKHVMTADTNASIRSGGAALNNTIYLGVDFPAGGRLTAIDTTRRFAFSRWELVTQNRTGISSAPAIYQNTIYFADEGGAVHAVSEDKSPAWGLEHSAFQTDGRIIADVVMAEGALYIASGDTKLYCVGAIDGRLRWQYYSAIPLVDAPTVVGDTVYQPVPGVGVVAVDNTGKGNRDAKWTAKGATKFLSQDDKFVYLRATDNRIIACDRSTGAVKFRSKRDDLAAFASNPKSPTIYAATRDGEVMAILPITKPGTMGAIVMTPSETTPSETMPGGSQVGELELAAVALNSK